MPNGLERGACIGLGVIVGAVAPMVNARGTRAIVSPAAQAGVRSTTKQPHALEFEPETLDLGDQPWLTTLTVSLVICNRSNRSVRISGVSSNCGCMVVDGDTLAGLVLPAGRRFAFDVRLRADANPGRKVRTIEVRADDEASANAYLMLNVVGTWSLGSDSIDFGNADELGPDGDVRVVTFESRTVALLEAIPDRQFLRVSVDRQDANAALIAVRLLPELLPLGVSTATVRIRTNCRERDEAAILVRVFKPETAVKFVPEKE